MHVQPQRGRRATQPGSEAVLRLLHAERSHDVLPLLLEEVLALGYPRAALLGVNFDSGNVALTAALHWARQQMARFTTALWVAEHPVISILNANRPAVLPRTSLHHRPVYLHPILFSNRDLCWEAGRPRTGSCLAADNFRREKRVRLEDQVCSTCEMRGYAAVVVVELPRHNSEAKLLQLGNLIRLANQCPARLFKVDHYYNRMRDMDITIAQMGTVMQSMADPVILTDTQNRVIMQNSAAEGLFKVPDEMTEELVLAEELNNLLFAAALSSMLSSAADAHR